MNTISEILNLEYSNQGIQDLEIFYDSIFFKVKILDGSSYNDAVLIEKIGFDYESETLERLKNGILVNFGDTEFSQPFKSNGNCLVDTFLDKRDKGVWLVGLKVIQNGNTIPVVYKYDINSHGVKTIFPNSEYVNYFQDIGSFENFTFDSTVNPVANYSDGKISILFQTTDSTFSYINLVVLKTDKASVVLEKYFMFKYSPDITVQPTGVNDSTIFYTIQDYHGQFKYV